MRKSLSLIRVPERRGEAGFITLSVSLGILMLLTMVTFSVSRSVLMEQKIANNDNRARQAFEAAEAGVTAAINYLKEDPDADTNGVIDPVFDTNADGVGDSNTTTVGTGRVVVTTTDLTGNMTEILISAQGFSDDNSATRTIDYIYYTINPLPNTPDNPVVTRGSIILTGSATVHNPEGQSTIWSGGDIDLGSNNSTTTRVPDIGDPGYPACMDVPMTCVLVAASNRLIAGVDIIENDSSLGGLSESDFFENFFGMPPATYRASMVTIDTTPANVTTAAHLATHEVIWVEGNTNFSSVTVGCKTAITGSAVCSAANTKPSIMIVNGDATFSGSPHFYGILFVTGSINVSGNSTVHGAMVVGGSVGSSTGGSMDIWYSSSVLDGTALAGNSTGNAGTWKDF